MLGAIAGDIIGSPYEVHNLKSTRFPLFRDESRFTDDTVLTIATADAILSDEGYAENYKEYQGMYPNAGYGPKFIRWARSSNSEPYNSWGNGSAMRVSPVAWAWSTLDEVLAEAERSAAVTHNHPDGIKGARATAAAIFLARTGAGKEQIRDYLRAEYGYALTASIETIRPTYYFDMSCIGTVPVAVTAFLESESWEDAVRRAVSVGGDSDTIASITGAIAHAFYGMPAQIAERTFERLDQHLIDVVLAFDAEYGIL